MNSYGRGISGIFCLLLTAIIPIHAQHSTTTDTLRLRLPEVEQQFVEKNLLLLANRYNVDISNATIDQLGLWDNPHLSIEQNIYNPDTKKYFDVTRTGESIIQIEQLIQLGGKRSKRIQLEESNRAQAEYAFYDLMRSLKYELRTSFFDLYFLQQTLSVIDRQIQSVHRIVEAYDTQYTKGNISEAELVRLKSLLFTLENDRIDVISRSTEKQSSLNLLLQPARHSVIIPIVENRTDSTTSVPLDSLRSIAIENRSDLKGYEEAVRYEERDISYQHSLAIPDLTIGASFDRSGSYVQNYTAVTIGIDLPFFNRNQGNVAVAELKLQQNKLLFEQYKRKVEDEVTQAYARLGETERLYRSSDSHFTDDFTKLIDTILSNYQKHTIGILEFTDLIEAYKASMVQMNTLQSNRLHALEDVNYAIGTTIFNR